jgi:hypothetical protein
MYLQDSIFAKHVVTSYSFAVGNFYYFNNFIVVEYAEGATVSFESLKEIITTKESHFGNTTPFGLIVNKVNTYAIIPTDANLIESQLTNLIATAVVTYNDTAKLNFELENYFFSINRKHFNTLNKAQIWIKEQLDVVGNKNILDFSSNNKRL